MPLPRETVAAGQAETWRTAPIASITFDDGSGTQTISPGSSVVRFNGWRPVSRYAGEQANGWGDGRLYQWPGRVDYAVAWELPHLPYSDQQKLEAFLLHANSGGLFVMTTDDLDGNEYSECQVAPGHEIELEGPDPATLDYTLRGVSVDMSASPSPLICLYG